MFLKQLLRRLLGRRRFVTCREGFNRAREVGSIFRGEAQSEDEELRRQDSIARLTDPRWALSATRLGRMQNRHAGQRCFVIGNGPSLRNTDLSLLDGEATFGANRIYLLHEEQGFVPTYYCATNALVVEQFASDIERIPAEKFVNWRCRDMISFDDRMIFVNISGKPHAAPWFSTEPFSEVCGGGTVTYVALELAFYMGFAEVYLVGVDHSFSSKGEPHRVVRSEGDDPDHFDGRYFGRGIRWQLPDLERSELAYRLAHYQFSRAGRRILDATIGGHLTVFPKVEYHTLFSPQPAGDAHAAGSRRLP